ncbi:MAG TPA: tetratricopeptide repeat protein [Usitatibacter sp.]|nr:tetratricopeptide repeat protein [Usitatibacter sp.]
MSLLLDALKRAEQEKLARHAEAPATARDTSGPQIHHAATGLELQPLGTAPDMGTPAAAPAASAPRSEAAAHAAQVVFRAKAPANEPARGRGMLWATVGLIGVAILAAGAYVWYSVRTLTPQLVAAAAVRPPPAPTPAPAEGMTIGELPAALPAPRGASALPPTSSASSSSAPAVAAVLEEAPAAPRRSESLVAGLLRDAPAPRPDASDVQLARTPEKAARVPAEVASGYEALRAGDVAAARRAYQAALAADSQSLDAMLGMATVEARNGNRPQAAAHYRKALELDPRNATALAGLAALADPRSEGIESRLREDLARNPDNAALRFALGNVYASQSRWSDAQAEYFEAHRLDPAAPDILYNLAVSLDQLGQTRLAAEHYRRTLEAARGQPVQFEPAVVARRLAEIAPGAPR